MDAVWVTLAALVTALATGLGALPFAFVGEMSRRWLGVSNAIAAGFMLSASGALLIEGAIRGVWRTAAGAAVGAVFIWATHRALGDHELQLGALRGADALKGILIVGVMTLHSFSRGCRDRRLLRRRRRARHLHHDRNCDPQHPRRASRSASCSSARGERA